MDVEQLVKLSKQGDEHAMSLLYTLYASKLECICRKYIENPYYVKDLVHDAFVIIFSSLHTLDDEKKFEMWSAVIAKNLALQFLRSSKHLQAFESVDESNTPTTISADEELSFKDLLSIVEQLPQKYKQVFKLSVFEGMTHNEISKALGINPHTSSSQLCRAKRILQEYALRYGMWLFVVTALLIPLHIEKRIKNGTDAKNFRYSTTEEIDSKHASIHVAPHITENNSYYQGIPSIVQDVDSQYSDTINIQNDEVQQHIDNNMPLSEQLIAYTEIDMPHKSYGRIGISISLTGGTESNTFQSTLISGGIGSAEGNNTFEEVHYHYHTPIGAAVAFNMQVSHKFSIETGLRYTYQRIDKTVISPKASFTTLHNHYIGIPIKAMYSVYDDRRINAYVQTGIRMDIPLGTEKQIKWSLSGGLGIQYNLTPSIGIYTEPSIEYNTSTSIQNTENKRFEPSIPIGIRVTW